MNPITQQVLADIGAATTIELLGQIYGWAATNIADPEELQAVAAACQARDAVLCAPAPPMTMPAPAPVVVPESIVAVATTVPAWLANAGDLAIGTRNATGNGGLPALDTLRVTMVDLTAAAWDCGIDLTAAPHIKDVQTATPDQIWKMATYMLDAIRTQLAIQKTKP